MFQIFGSKILVFLFALFVLLLIPKTVSAEWSQYRYDNTRSAAVPYSLGNNLKTKWEVKLPLSTNLIDLVDSDGNIYMRTSAGISSFGLSSYDKNGNFRWRYSTSSAIGSAVSSDEDGNIYLNTTGCCVNLISLNKDGEVNWIYDKSRHYGSPFSLLGVSLKDKLIYVGIGYQEYTINAIDFNGKFVWSRSVPGNVPLAPVAIGDDGTIYFGVHSKPAIYAINPNGTVKFFSVFGSLAGLSSGNPVIGTDGNIYIGGFGVPGGDLIASYTLSGARRFVYQATEGQLQSSFAFYEDRLVFVEGKILKALDTKTGKILWSKSSPFGLTSPIIDKDGNVYMSDFNRMVVYSKDGELKWDYPAAWRASELILAEDNLLYLINTKNNNERYLTALTSVDIPPTKTPVIFIPGIGGSEFKTAEEINWSQDNGHGGIFNHTYPKDEVVWFNFGALFTPSQDYFDILKIKPDGITSEANLVLTGNLFTGAYDSAIKFFNDNGYTSEKDFFIFPYDWRKDLNLTTPLLESKIQEIRQKTGSSTVDIVAHSMGGLVAKKYIVDPPRAKNIRKLITVGTPYLGSVNSLKNLLYGDCLTSINQVKNSICLGVIPQEIKDVIQNMTGSFQLSPTQKYFDLYGQYGLYPFLDEKDLDNNGIKGSLNYNQTKELLNNLGHNISLLNLAESFHDIDLSTTNEVDVNIISGSGISTLGQIVEKYAFNFLGIKIPKRDEIMLNGDETVPLLSSSLEDLDRNISLKGSAKTFYTKQKHGELVLDGSAMQLVKNILENKSDLPSGVSLKPFKLRGKQLSVHSPVTLNAYDELGNHTGPTDDGFEENIPGSTYDTLEDAKFIWLPEDGIYTVKMEATDQGSFDFKIRNFENDINDKTVLFKDVPLTTTTNVEVDLDTQQIDTTILSVDPLGDGSSIVEIPHTSVLDDEESKDLLAPNIKINLEGNKGNNGWYKSDIKIDIETSDASGSGILNVEYKLNDEEVKIYDQPIILGKEGAHKIKVKAIDKAGNENFVEQEIKIDKTSPEANIVFDMNKKNFVIKNSETSLEATMSAGIASMEDEAGNITTLEIEPKELKKKENISIKSIRYNNQQKINPGGNFFEAKLKLDKKDMLKDFDQMIVIKGDERVKANYKKDDNITKLTTKVFKQEKTVESIEGMILIQLKTNSGKLDFTF